MFGLLQLQTELDDVDTGVLRVVVVDRRKALESANYIHEFHNEAPMSDYQQLRVGVRFTRFCFLLFFLLINLWCDFTQGFSTLRKIGFY